MIFSTLALGSHHFLWGKQPSIYEGPSSIFCHPPSLTVLNKSGPTQPATKICCPHSHKQMPPCKIIDPLCVWPRSKAIAILVQEWAPWKYRLYQVRMQFQLPNALYTAVHVVVKCSYTSNCSPWYTFVFRSKLYEMSKYSQYLYFPWCSKSALGHNSTL